MNKTLENVALLLAILGISIFGIILINNITINQPSFNYSEVTPNGIESDTQIINEVVIENKSKPVIKKARKLVSKLDLDPDRTIYLYGFIGKNARQGASQIREFNYRNTKEPIYVRIYSGGGSVIDGANFLSAMQSSKAPIYTICDNFCASMAAMIHQYGTKRYATDRAILMFHPASTRAGGDVDRIHSYTSLIKNYVGKIEAEVAANMKMSYSEYKNKSAVELWIDSDQAASNNAVDKIVYLASENYSLLPKLRPLPGNYKHRKFLWIYEEFFVWNNLR